MKRIAAFSAMFLFLFVTENRADDTFTRVGITFLGTGFLSLTAECGRGDTSLRLRAGMFEPGEICLSADVHEYFGRGEFRPHIGAGIWNVMIFPEEKFGSLTFLTLPAGVEYEFRGKHSLGLEGDINCFLTGRAPGGGPVSWGKREEGFRRRLLPLPAVYYLSRLE